MTAMIQRAHGAPLELGDVAAAAPERGEVRIAIEYCGLNHLDLWLKRGNTGDKLSLPRIPGSDVVGTVAEAGEDAGFEPGDRVLLYPARSCDECPACASGNESACRFFEVLGYNFDGGYATSITVKARNVVRIPADAGPEWAAVPVSYITAWNALVAKAGLRAGETVVIWGAAGGLGNAALRIAEAIGARPIAVVGDEDKEQWLRRQGHTGPVLQRGDGLVRAVREATGKAGAQVVLDHVGAATWMDSVRMLATRGRLAFCGVTSGYDAQFDLRHLLGKQLSIQGTWLGDRRDLEAVVQLLRDNPSALPVVERSYPLTEANDAQEFLDAGLHSGKVTLAV